MPRLFRQLNVIEWRQLANLSWNWLTNPRYRVGFKDTLFLISVAPFLAYTIETYSNALRIAARMLLEKDGQEENEAALGTILSALYYNGEVLTLHNIKESVESAKVEAFRDQLIEKEEIAK